MDAVARSPGEGKASGAELMLISGENWEILFVKWCPNTHSLKNIAQKSEQRSHVGIGFIKESNGK